MRSLCTGAIWAGCAIILVVVAWPMILPEALPQSYHVACMRKSIVLRIDPDTIPDCPPGTDDVQGVWRP